MSLKKKAQSTAEYAITLGLVVAITAGIIQVSLKSGMRQKNKEAMNYLLDAGSETLANLQEKDIATYGSDYRQTIVSAADYVDESILDKGGRERRKQKQKTDTTSVNIETLEAITD